MLKDKSAVDAVNKVYSTRLSDRPVSGLTSGERDSSCFLLVCGMSLNIVSRTNNPLERVNRKLNAAIPSAHPSLAAFVGTIDDLSKRFVFFLYQFNSLDKEHNDDNRVELIEEGANAVQVRLRLDLHNVVVEQRDQLQPVEMVIKEKRRQ
ncbi:hypothetical protein JG688_00014316 [Phytophthora aleatoria]|uniref:Uncharacterized protein n=1 Tax=Phytophthora aleatoria TaxID=2496075 RepID=A0A8J5IC18_9STRA|nr:hypothetical protein JG688_00014316 [Phytophthora aleatoria]